MYKKMLVASLLGTTLLSSALLSSAASADTLRIALGSEPTAIDPHYHDLTPNNALAAHIFEGLTRQDEQQKVHPALATSWENDGKNTWTFKLREGVTFSDGSPFTADDVVFTFCRTLKNETAIAGSFADITATFETVEAPDAHTLVI
ncbi:MAG: ABC transporter substrate-binding protein, partial [Brucellaceae bacterium]|nr:ABC transporter substrate-binding protein [Brucellaceae bacterium]